MASTSLPFPTGFAYLESVDLWNDNIIGHDGKSYSKLAFDSKYPELHRKIVKESRNSSLSTRIWSSCHKLLDGISTKEIKSLCEEWLNKHLFLLACKKHLLKALLKTEKLASLIPAFDREFNCIDHDHTPKPLSNRIIILTTSGGGGELSVARAIERQLMLSDYKVQLIDIKEALGTVDICRIFSGVHSTDIYSVIFQQNNNPDLAGDLWWRTSLLRDFILDEGNHLLSRTITELNPSLIINTCYFDPCLISTAYQLNVPMRIVHCDYVFTAELMPYAPLIDSEIIKFWVPHPECSPSQLSAEELKEKVDVLGYPINFEKIADSSQLIHFREKWGAGERKVIMMMMGRYGVGKTLIRFIEKINSSTTIFVEPIHVIVLCGRNEEMRKEIVDYLESVPHHLHVTYRIQGEIDSGGMAECYSIAHLLVGKSGGAATSELLDTNTFGLVFPGGLVELESSNLAFLEKWGLGTQLKNEEFIPQLKTILAKPKPLPKNMINWRAQLLSLCESDFKEGAKVID